MKHSQKNSLKLINGHQNSSKLIDTHQKTSKLIETHQNSSKHIKTHQIKVVVTRSRYRLENVVTTAPRGAQIILYSALARPNFRITESDFEFRYSLVEFWWVLIFFDVSWWCLMIFDDFWQFFMISDDLWYFLMTFDVFWWLMMHFDELWSG